MKIFDFDAKTNAPSYRERVRQKFGKSYESSEDNRNSSLPQETSDFDNAVVDANLPLKIDEKIEIICTIDREYQDALALANKSKESAKKAQELADKAAKQSAGFGKKKKAIEALQVSHRELSLATDANAQANAKLAELQEKIIEATKALFMLCTSSIAANRSVYRQLELKLSGASEQELSDFARNEIQNVMQQLNAQQDMMAKHKKLSDVVHLQKDQLEKQQQKIEELKQKQKEQEEAFSKKLNVLKNQIESLAKPESGQVQEDSEYSGREKSSQNLSSRETASAEKESKGEKSPQNNEEKKKKWWQFWKKNQ